MVQVNSIVAKKGAVGESMLPVFMMEMYSSKDSFSVTDSHFLCV